RGHQAHDDASAKALLNDHATPTEVVSLDHEERVAVINHLASTFDLAYSPHLLAQELLCAIRACELSPGIEIVKGPHAGERDPGRRSLSLGEVHGKPLIISCEVPDDPIKAILLGDVF